MPNRSILKLASFVLLSVIASVPLIVVTCDSIVFDNECEGITSECLMASYISSLPIVISSNVDFASQASANSWPGNGSATTPYIIEDLNVTSGVISQVLFNVSDTDVYFVLQDCLLVGGSVAVLLENVVHGSIVNNTIHDANEHGMLLTECLDTEVRNNTVYHTLVGSGVYLMWCEDTIVTNNTLLVNTDRGVLVDYSSLCVVERNIIAHNEYNGITVRDSDHIILRNNTIDGNSGTGIVLGNSPLCNISDNIIGNSSFRGISLEASAYTRVHRNLIVRNTYAGLSIEGSNSAAVLNNTFYNNGFYGVRVESNYVNVTTNNFVDNRMGLPPGAVPQGCDLGIGCLFAHNFWSDCLAPDSNHDGIVDSPYALDGPSLSKDYYARTVVYETQMMHILVRPIVLFPPLSNNGTVFSDSMNLTWAESSDTFRHGLSYSVYYNQSLAQNWVQLATELTSAYYLWNLTSVPDIVNCMVKVEAKCTEGLTSERISSAMFSIMSNTTTTSTTTTTTTTPGWDQGLILAFVGTGIAGIVVATVIVLMLRRRKGG